MLSCQGVNLAKYCREYNIDYSEVTVNLESHVEDIRHEEFPEYHLKVTVPDSFPKDHIEPMGQQFHGLPCDQSSDRAQTCHENFRQ